MHTILGWSDRKPLRCLWIHVTVFGSNTDQIRKKVCIRPQLHFLLTPPDTMPPLNSQTNSSMSGLGTLRRDWTDDVPPSQVSAVSWSPSPERPPRPKAAVIDLTDDALEPPTGLTMKERRLAVIKAALSQENKPTGIATTSSPTSTAVSSSARSVSGSSASSKRPAAAEWTTEPQKKRRQVPWEESHVKLKAAKRGEPPIGTKAPESREGKPSNVKLEKGQVSVLSKVTLSEEQQHVLKLVVEGKSVFFTGSAGSYHYFFCNILFASLIRHFCRDWKICSFTRNYPKFATPS
jgi:hypothetical protein